jgi:O-antigen ligase
VLATLAILRAWSDGITYPTNNTYFLWAILICFAIWTMRLSLNGGAFRHGIPTLLLGGFLIIALLTAFDTVQVDATYRTFLFWVGHFFLFLLAANAVRTRRAIAIVLGGFLLAQLTHAVWGYLHYEYVLPSVRRQVAENPTFLQDVFGADELNPELAHRLNVNRAFGSFLFPNALAAFLICGIPFVISEAVRSVASVRQALGRWRAATTHLEDKQTRLLRAVGAGTALFALLALTGWYTYTLVYEVATDRLDWWSQPGLSILFIGLLPLLASLGYALAINAFGIRIGSQFLSAATMPVILLFQFVSLWLTYSRGGYLALAGALVLGGALLYMARMREGRHGPQLSAATKLMLVLVVAAFAVSLVAPTLHAQQQAPAPTASQDFSDAIQEEGKFLTASDLANPASFKLRLSYWRTGLSMATHNFWSGVGLGNFGTVYPKYQLPGAAEVKAAHNDYLQAWCETGIFGALTFCGFWLYFAVWGAFRIVREADRHARWTLTGLYAGVMAFLAHAMADFNFFNPSLVFFVFLLAGVFYAYAAVDEVSRGQVAWHQYVSIPLLIVLAMTAGASARVYVADSTLSGDGMWSVGDLRDLSRKLGTAQQLLDIADEPANTRQLPVVAVSQLSPFVQSRAVLETFAELRVAVPGDAQATRPLSADQPVPSNALAVIRNRAKAKEEFTAGIEDWMGRLRMSDAIYPHSPHVAGVLYQANLLLQHHVASPDLRQKYVLQAVDWAQKAVERSPEQNWFHRWLGEAYWLRANVEQGAGSARYYQLGLEEMRRACELYPSSAELWRSYATMLTRMAEAVAKGDDPARAEALQREAKDALDRAQSLEKFS